MLPFIIFIHLKIFFFLIILASFSCFLFLFSSFAMAWKYMLEQYYDRHWIIIYCAVGSSKFLTHLTRSRKMHLGHMMWQYWQEHNSLQLWWGSSMVCHTEGNRIKSWSFLVQGVEVWKFCLGSAKDDHSSVFFFSMRCALARPAVCVVA